MRNRVQDKMKIILIRHGKTEGNYKKRYIGKTDEPLFDTKSIEGEYPKCNNIISSPMTRCIETAKFIYPNRKVTVCDNLRECDFGDFENKSYKDLKDDEYYKKWLKSMGTLPFPNGESHESFKKRCVKGFYECLDGRDTAFIIHGGSIMAIMQELFGGGFYDYQVKNGGGYVFSMKRRENGYFTANGTYYSIHS